MHYLLNSQNYNSTAHSPSQLNSTFVRGRVNRRETVSSLSLHCLWVASAHPETIVVQVNSRISSAQSMVVPSYTYLKARCCPSVSPVLPTAVVTDFASASLALLLPSDVD